MKIAPSCRIDCVPDHPHHETRWSSGIELLFCLGNRVGWLQSPAQLLLEHHEEVGLAYGQSLLQLLSLLRAFCRTRRNPGAAGRV